MDGYITALGACADGGKARSLCSKIRAGCRATRTRASASTPARRTRCRRARAVPRRGGRAGGRVLRAPRGVHRLRRRRAAAQAGGGGGGRARGGVERCARTRAAPGVQEHGCAALNTVCFGFDAASVARKGRAASAGAVEAVVGAPRAHAGAARLQEQACRALNSVCSGADEWASARCERAAAGAIEAVVGAMSAHADAAGVQEQGAARCGACAPAAAATARARAASARRRRARGARSPRRCSGTPRRAACRTPPRSRTPCSVPPPAAAAAAATTRRRSVRWR